MRRMVAGVVIGGLSLAVVACGGDDDPVAVDDDLGVVEDAGTGDADADAPDAGFPDACPAETPFSLDLRSEGADDPAPFEVVDAAALRRGGGGAFTVYLSDVDIPDDTSWQLVTPDVGDGTLVYTGIDVFNTDFAEVEPLTVGDGGPLFREAGAGVPAAFLSIFRAGEAGGSENATGGATVLGVSDERICIEVDIRSERGAVLVGVYAAPIVAEL